LQFYSAVRQGAKSADLSRYRFVIAGLVPAIPILDARSCHVDRDGRDKPGHDGGEFSASGKYR
jgi:hypothetical protein